ncbi:marvel domain-containing protein [Xylariaceae sp. FL0016]|nr:marvel domain-containing protein [Xylariaceae sp. FL0016]
MFKIAGFALRGFLLIFGAVVLGLSVTLAKLQKLHDPPTETSFSSFTGAFGLLVSVIGIAAIFIEKIPSVVVMGADALASIFYLAGGIAMTIALKPVDSCTSLASADERFNNKLLNGGCVGSGAKKSCYADDDQTQSSCQKVRADYVFEYLAFAFGVAMIATTFFLRRRGSSSTAYV